jgi:hypothetical protein
MSKRGFVLLALAVVGVGCCGLGFLTQLGRLQNLRSLGEVTAVVDGDRPGTVIVGEQRAGRDTWWRVDDRGEVLAWADDAGRAAGQPRVQQCAGTVCYRVGSTALRVDVSNDGGTTYTPSWEVGGAAYATLAESYPDIGDPAEHLASRSLVVHAVEGGHVVIVADGRDGLLYRDVRGMWHRLGFPSSGEGCCFYEPALPIAAGQPLLDAAGFASVVVAAAVLLSGGLAMIRRPRRWADIAAVIVLAALAAYGTVLAGHFPGAGMFPGLFCGIPIIGVILVSGVVLAWLFVTGMPTRRSGSAAAQASPPPDQS